MTTTLVATTLIATVRGKRDRGRVRGTRTQRPLYRRRGGGGGAPTTALNVGPEPQILK